MLKLQKIRRIYNKIVQRQLQNKHDKEIPKRRYICISPEERRKIIDDLRLCNSIMMEYQKIIFFFRK